MRKGDRFKAKTSYEFIVEVVDDNRQKLVSNPTLIHGFRVGMIADWGNLEILSNWEYLGNFAKSSNFNTLYEKLNSTT